MPPPRELAAWHLRAGAILVDQGAFVLLALAIGLSPTSVALGIVTLAAYSIYWLALLPRPGEHNGQTLGKQLLSIRVIRIDGEPVDLSTVAIRQVLMQAVPGLIPFLNALYFLANYLLPLVDEENRALHDHVAGTRVVMAR